jgi:predicted O-methyltransferase YrrM
MLRGFVDENTDTQVSGWAADDERPNEAVDVYLSVGGALIAQISCDQPRPDLSGRFGDGRHGFRYKFERPLINAKALVRFKASNQVVPSRDDTLSGTDLGMQGQNMRRPPTDAVMRPLDWPPMSVEVITNEATLAALLERVESMFAHLGDGTTGDANHYLAAMITSRPPEFFEFGKLPIKQFLATLARCGIVQNFETCFELGCGIGRSTVWLAEHFPKVIAADISGPAVRETRQNLERFGRNNVTVLHTNRTNSLRDLPTLDAFFSMVVFQHNPPPVQHHVLGILLSKLRPGGVGYFQVPTQCLGYQFNAASHLAKPLNLSSPEMHVFPQPELHKLIDTSGCRLLEIREDPIPGNFVSSRLLVEKKER